MTIGRLTSDEKTEMELLVDRVGMVGVLDSLNELCGEKADHLRSNWQDEAGARDWESVGKRLAKCCTAMLNLNL